jgi:hypothetical protein
MKDPFGRNISLWTRIGWWFDKNPGVLFMLLVSAIFALVAVVGYVEYMEYAQFMNECEAAGRQHYECVGMWR